MNSWCQTLNLEGPMPNFSYIWCFCHCRICCLLARISRLYASGPAHHLADVWLYGQVTEEIFSLKFLCALPSHDRPAAPLFEDRRLAGTSFTSPLGQRMGYQYNFSGLQTLLVCLKAAVRINCPGGHSLADSHRSISLAPRPKHWLCAKTSKNRPCYQRWVP